MFNLEFKKIIKRKLFLIIIIGAAILAYNNIDKVSSEFYTNMHSETKENSGNVMNLKTMNKIEELKVNGKIEEAELLQERFGNYRDISEERRLLRLKALEEQGLNKETNKEYILKSNEEINYFNNIAKNFDIKLTQSQRDSIKWDSLKNYYFIENNSYEIDIKDQYNLGRFFRFGNENLFGIVSLLLLAFLSFDSLPKEYENGTIITPLSYVASINELNAPTVEEPKAPAPTNGSGSEKNNGESLDQKKTIAETGNLSQQSLSSSSKSSNDNA